MMRIKLRSWGLLSSLLFLSAGAYASLTTANLTSTKDSYINYKYPSQNFGTSSTMSAGTHTNIVSKFGTTYTYDRTYVQFDLSSIPANAIIYSATLKLHVSGTSGSAPSWYVKRVLDSWIESGTASITASNQPALSTLASDYVSSSAQYSTPHTFSVTSMVQRMVYGQITNNGWCLQSQNEGLQAVALTTFHTKEASNSSYYPELEVKYYLPISLSNVVVTHESQTSASDGGVSYTVNNGASSSFTYAWTNSSGTSVGTSQTLSGVPYGWYGLTITGVQYGEVYYMGFLIGTECEEVTINFRSATGNNFENFFDNALNTDYDNGVDYGDVNSANNLNFQSSHDYIGVEFSTNTYARMRLWMDDQFTVNQADLYLYGKNHSGTADASEFDIVTSYWYEDLISWNNQPTTSSSTTVAVPEATSSTENKVVDISDFWNVWKADNTTNHGMLFQLQSFSAYTNIQNYYTPVDATETNRPRVAFKLALWHEDEPFVCSPVYAVTKRDLTGVWYKSVEDTLYFSFDNEYASSSSYVDYEIYYYTDMLTPVMEGGTTQVSMDFGVNHRTLGVGSLNSGDRYVMVVTNDKGEKRYLRFEKD